jgi:hypothetical protein
VLVIGPALNWPTSARGIIIEQYVIAQALRHGFQVAVPVVDLGGIGLYIFNTRAELISVQVKTAREPKPPRRPSWELKLTSETPAKRTTDRRTRQSSADVFVAVSSDFTRLWVVPAMAVAYLKSTAPLREKWRDRWDVIESVAAFRAGRAP